MALSDLMREVKALSQDELEALYVFVRDQREFRRLLEHGSAETRIAKLNAAAEAIRAEMSDDDMYAAIEAMNATDDRHNNTLDMDDLKAIFADLREGFTEQDLDELDWAMNVEVVHPLDEDV